MTTESVVRFAGCELDLATRELRIAGEPQPIEPKAFDLLAYLLDHRERVVTKDELQDAIWPDVVVTEASLARSIMKARKAVGDDAHRQEIIKTLPKRGYRFVAPTNIDAAAPQEPAGLSPVHFAPCGDLQIAWRTLGDGPQDMLFIPGFVSHLDFRYRIRMVSRFDSALAEHGRLIVFDKRGVGLSERVGQEHSIEHTVEDMLTVLDAAGSERAILFGVSESGPATVLFATRYPERVRAVIMYSTLAKGLWSDDYPWAATRKRYDAWLDELLSNWGGPLSVEYFAPSLAQDEEARAAWARYLRGSATPATVRGILEACRDIDVRDLLPQISVPTLVLHRRGDRLIPSGGSQHMAENIPGARFRLLEGDDHWWFVGNQQAILREIDQFIAELPA